MASFNGGGIERIIINLARGFIDKGYLIDIVVINNKGSLKNQIPKEAKIVVLNGNRALNSIGSLIGYLNNNRPDIFLSPMIHLNIISLISRMLSKNKYTKLIISEHVSPKKYKNNIKNFILKKSAKYLYQLADGVISISKGIRKDLEEFYNIDSKVIYNPVIREEIFELSKNKVDLPWDDNKEYKLIIGVGRLNKVKGFDVLIRAFSLAKKTVDIKLIILGEGKDRESLTDLINKLNITNDVYMPGFVSNPYKYINKSDIFILSSRNEALPTVLIESLALNKLIISTDCEHGPKEILKNGQYGILTPVDDYKTLAKKIITSVKRDLKFEIEESFLEDFKTENVLIEYIRFFENLKREKK